MSAQKTEHIHGDTGFGMGFFCGTILGAIGVYLTVTPEGKKLKQKLIEEFHSFKTSQLVITDEPIEEVMSGSWLTKLEEAQRIIRIIKQRLNPVPAVTNPKNASLTHNSDKKKRFFKAK